MLSGTRFSFVGENIQPKCQECGYVVLDANQCELVLREVNLRTLHHGYIRIKVLDAKCPARD